jgi:apolipoprotein D and lipocalin family protein
MEEAFGAGNRNSDFRIGFRLLMKHLKGRTSIKIGFKTILFSGLFLLLQCQAQKRGAMIDTSTVPKVDLNRYMGTWYEIARFPHSFEKNLVGVTATYTLKPDGKIEVLNQGYLNSLEGKLKTARGKAKVPDPGRPGRLKVSFFLFFYGDYFILELDRENYQWVMIGSSSPGYFWILSRSPVMPENIYRELLENARQRGYDLSRLQKVLQKDPGEKETGNQKGIVTYGTRLPEANRNV